MYSKNWCRSSLLASLMFLTLSQSLMGRSVFGQPIQAANDGTGTVVIQQGNQFNITGGSFSSDNANLFHSLEKFGLSADQIANFIANPQLRNVLTRIVGGQPSLVDGLIQVTGGNPNLFLINPSGFIFGSNARLNVPSSFTATTSTALGFESGQWFEVFDQNDYAALTGDPISFEFSSTNPGSIINSAQLITGNGDLSLVAGSVISTGEISAPDSNIAIVSVPNSSRVRLSQPGNVLSLVIDPPLNQNGQPSPFTALDLPDLLTVGTVDPDAQLVVEQDTITLANFNIPVVMGDVLIQHLKSNNAIISSDQNLILPESQLQTTGDLELFAQNQIIVRDRTAAPVNLNSGDALTLQGDQGIDVFALNNSASSLQAGDNLILRSDGEIIGDAHYFTGGDFRIEQLDTRLGSFFSPLDPVVRASGDVTFDSYSGASLHILAGGTVNVTGNIEITGVDTLANSLQETITLSDGTSININGNTEATLDIRAGTTAFGTPGITGGTGGFTPAAPGTAGAGSGTSISIGSITNNQGGRVFLSNQYQSDATLAGSSITVGNITGAGSDVTIDSRSNIVAGTIDTSFNGDGGNVRLLAVGGITISSVNAQGNGGNGGDVNARTFNVFRSTGTFTDQNGVNASISTAGNTGGAIIITENGGDTPFTVGDASANGTAGALTTGAGNTIFPTRPFTESYVQGNSPSQIEINRLESAAGSGTGNNAPPQNSPPVFPSLAIPDNEVKTLEDIQRDLSQVEDATGVKPGLIYVSFWPRSVSNRDAWRDRLETTSASQILEDELTGYLQGEAHQSVVQVRDKENTPDPTQELTSQLELVLVTSQGVPTRVVVPGETDYNTVVDTIQAFRNQIIFSASAGGIGADQQQSSDIPLDEQLYQWLVQPLKETGALEGISNLVFVMDYELSSIPLAALRNPQTKRFLIEDYSLGLMPSMSLTDTRYRDIRDFEGLIMGSDQITGSPQLPRVIDELDYFTRENNVEIKDEDEINSGEKKELRRIETEILRNDEFTIGNFESQQARNAYGLVHIATHGVFSPESPQNSYLEFNDGVLNFDDFRRISLRNRESIELLVLSACETSIGSSGSNLGFAGYAHQSGVKSVLGSLWPVDDFWTSQLMMGFYDHLFTFNETTQEYDSAIKAKALQSIQIDLLEQGQSPYYWSGFTLVGNPW
ncbi:MAG: CHAT domain-containing protein [Cyanobacteria bacterium P01_G01_bin.54]